MRHVLPLLVTAALLTPLSAVGGKKKPEPAADAESARREPPQVRVPERVVLPRDLGALPAGLANASAQACHACHVEPTSQWTTSAHARGVTPALAKAARAAGDPACLSCHLPLQQQHAPVAGQPAGAWSATLTEEGVTCVACHVWDGKVVGARPPGQSTPHATGWSSRLSDPALCATCHQLTWPGATQPLYDTYGEWQRSAWAKAGVTCQDCHMGPGAGAVRSGADHAWPADPGRAVSVLVSMPSPTLVRGAAPSDTLLTLQNTGAGHAFPSGSPHTAIVVRVVLEDPQGQVRSPPLLEARLGQVAGDAPPWPILQDTRLPAGGEQAWSFPVALDTSEPSGAWRLRVDLIRTIGAEEAATPAVTRRVTLHVE